MTPESSDIIVTIAKVGDIIHFTIDLIWDFQLKL